MIAQILNSGWLAACVWLALALMALATGCHPPGHN